MTAEYAHAADGSGMGIGGSRIPDLRICYGSIMRFNIIKGASAMYMAEVFFCAKAHDFRCLDL